MKYIYISMALMLWTTESGAITFPWKIATSLDVNITSATSAIYTLHLTTIQVTDDSIGEGDLARDVIGRHTGYYTLPTWGAFHRHNSNDGGPPVVSKMAVYAPTQNISWGTFAQRIISLTSNTLSIEHSGSPNGGECVGTSAFSWDSPALDFDRWVADFSWNAGVGSRGDCLGTPPVNQWCALSTAVVDVDFSALHISEAAGTTANDNISVHCTAGMKYTLRLRGVDAIPLSNGMKAEITANGMQLNSTLDGLEGDNPVQLTTKLAGTPNSDGAFEGSGVLFISYP